MRSAWIRTLRAGVHHLARRLGLRFYSHPRVVQAITNQFHRLYYYTPARTWQATHWLGIPVYKCPLDAWIYQEILHEVRPDLIIESGTFRGGTALFLASLCDLLGRGRVVSIDVQEFPGRPPHDRLTYVAGASLAPATLAHVQAMVGEHERVMVVLDSDHSMAYVLAEMRAYGRLVSPGSYLIVEDTNINGHPVARHYGPGPWEAVQAFLRENKTFVVDAEREKFYLSFNPGGYLKKIG